ncbi:unnamed protein product [Paramecium sonneborni]|uniref:Uncharacterized protein n=1 Tax=Paramecium sonneborni TaxID=65129 RepID=A0A8S1R8P1_9CILI|nr:unnamed protein product [Paramecium sonneborni]
MQIRQVFSSKIKNDFQEIEKELDVFICYCYNFSLFLIRLIILQINYSFQSFQFPSLTKQNQKFSLPRVEQLDLIDQFKFSSEINHNQSKQNNQELNLYLNSILNHLIIKLLNKVIQQEKRCWAVAFNKDCSITAATCEKLIKLYEFRKGMMKQIQVLNEHKSFVTTLNFMNKYNQFIYYGGFIFIWSINSNNQWIFSQALKEHSIQINCLIMNYNEDLIISSSSDLLLSFGLSKMNGSFNKQSQIIKILNEECNKVISCGWDQFLLIIEYQKCCKKWIVIQNIKIDCQGYRICFINNNLFAFQPNQGNLMHIYDINSLSKKLNKTKLIPINQGDDDYGQFPLQIQNQKATFEQALQQYQLNKKDRK